MGNKYRIGQKVVVTPAKDQPVSPRDSGLEPYAGRVGQVIDYHWVSPSGGLVFYIYTVRLEPSGRDIVLHEDELEPYTG